MPQSRIGRHRLLLVAGATVAASTLTCAGLNAKSWPGIKTIRLPLPYRLGSVNCYLANTANGYVLIDTGCAKQRADLDKELASAGCRPGDLKLVVLTHGDFDHTGNAAYLRNKFGARIAMHQGDSGMVEWGDMFWNRKKGNSLPRTIAPILFGFGKAERFVPDLYVEDGDDLSTYGFAAQVLHLPGHSKGSIGILAASGALSAGSGQTPLTDSGQILFCGDLLSNKDEPALDDIIDDEAAARASVERLKSLDISTACPGHGKPFPMEQFIKTNR